jgi:hypothetical protein
MVSAMRSGWVQIIEKVPIAWFFKIPEADLYIAENASHIKYTDTWLSKGVHWLSRSQSPHCATSNYQCEDTFEL